MKRCRHCGLEQPDDAFGICLIRGDKVYRRQQCRQCKQARVQGRKTELREWFADYKKTLHCLKCGFADFRALTFHHERAQEKAFTIADMLSRGHAVASIQREIAKCIVLCCNCHRITHADEWAAAISSLSSASTTQTLPDAAEPELQLTGVRIVCRYCLVEQDESWFEVCKVVGGKAYRRLKCRRCKRVTQNRRRHRLRAWLESLKKTLRCADCGFDDYRALEFHHPDGEEKDFAIGEMLQDNRSIAAVDREIGKCIVLCANCHRIFHYNEWNCEVAPIVQTKNEQS